MSKIEREEHMSSTKRRQVWLAQTFHKQMTLGQSFKTSNGYRKDFYKNVILLAKEVNILTFPVFEIVTFFFSSWNTVD